MHRYIGKVLFEDFCDTEIDVLKEETKKLLKLVTENSKEEYNHVIEAEKDPRVLSALTHIRENTVSWLPVKKTDKVLEIGTDMGALTGVLCEKAGSVTVIDHDRERAFLCANRHRTYENLSVYAGNVEEVTKDLCEEYDWIFLIESFERAQEQIHGHRPHKELLLTAKNILRANGKVVVGTGNRLGLKYMAGNKEEAFGTYFKNLEGYEDSETAKLFSRPELINLAKECGYEMLQMYYPYPDLTYTMSVYSDQYLPKVGELWDNRRNYEEERYVLFDETKAFDNLVKDGLFPIFSNAFLMILEKEAFQEEKRIIYTKYSNERGPGFAIRTDILENADGTRVARKIACGKEGEQHVQNLLKWQKELESVYAESPIRLNRCEPAPSGVWMEYLTGQTLEEELDLLLLEGKKGEALEKFLEYLEVIRTAGSVEIFEKTPEFEQVFGEVCLPAGLTCSSVTDIDMVAGNVIKDGKHWIHMDFEWTFQFPIPVNYVLYRIIQNFIHGNVKRTVMEKEWLYKRVGLTDLERAQYTKMEAAFQNYIIQKNIPLRMLYDEVSPGCISFAEQEELRKKAAESENAANTGIEVFVDSFEVAMKGIFVYGWAVSKEGRKVTFELKDEQGRTLETIGTEYLFRKDVADNFKLSGKNSYAGFRLHCALSDEKSVKNRKFTLVARDGRREVPFEIPVGKLRIKQSRFGKKVMDFVGKKDVITYIAPKEMGIISESAHYRVENQRFDTWQTANKLTVKEIERERKASFALEPAFTMVILCDKKEKEAKKTADSIERQTYKKADIVYSKLDGIRWEELSGSYIFLMNPGDTLKINALYEFTKKINENPEAKMIYSDSDKVDWVEKEFFDPQFKPDFSPVTLKSGNYIGNSICFFKELLIKVGRPAACYGMQAIYDLILRCSDETEQVSHISKLLYHEAAPMKRDFEGRKKLEADWEHGRVALADYFKRKEVLATVKWANYPLRYQVKLQMEKKPLVSIIIPNQDHVNDLEVCLSSIAEKSTYKNVEILVVENNSRESATFAYYKEMEKIYRNVRLLRWESEFNYSAINNFAAKEAKGEYLVFLNNDTEILTCDWLEEMMSTCYYSGDGVVGARLYYPDGSLQHAGVILGLGNVAGHLYVKEPGNISGYMGRVCTKQNLSAVTAACMMCSKEAFDRVEGFDERLKVALNDVDFCLKCIKAGYPVVYDPEVELYHYESKSRGLDTTPEKKARYDSEVALFLKKWQSILDQGDPYYNVNLSRTTWNCALRIPRE